MLGRSVNLTTLFLGRLRPPKRLTNTLASNSQLPSLNQLKEKQSMWPDWVWNPGPLALQFQTFVKYNTPGNQIGFPIPNLLALKKSLFQIQPILFFIFSFMGQHITHVKSVGVKKHKDKQKWCYFLYSFCFQQVLNN